MVSIARDSGYFSYLSDAIGRGVEIRIVLGDGRIELAASPEHFALIIVDAFSSDTIPLHLATREAFEIYRGHLGPGGILGLHYSSRYLDLRPILARLAASAEPPMIGLFREDLLLSEREKRAGKAASKWAVMTASSDTGTIGGRFADRWNACLIRSVPRCGRIIQRTFLMRSCCLIAKTSGYVASTSWQDRADYRSEQGTWQGDGVGSGAGGRARRARVA